MSPNDADGMANNVDPDQTAPLGAVWSGSALFAQAYLSENLGSLRYVCCNLNLLITRALLQGSNTPYMYTEYMVPCLEIQQPQLS